MNQPANLTDAEVDDICAGYTSNAAKLRHLRSMGLTVYTKPNGRPLVARANYDAVMNPAGRAAHATGGAASAPGAAVLPAWSVAA